MFDASKTLFFDGGHQLSVFENYSRSVAVICVNAKDRHISQARAAVIATISPYFVSCGPPLSTILERGSLTSGNQGHTVTWSHHWPRTKVSASEPSPSVWMRISPTLMHESILDRWSIRGEP